MSGAKTMKNTTKKKVNVTASVGNVFTDLMLPEAEDRLLKAQLALKIHQLIDQKEMTQAEIAPLIGLDQPKVSNLMRGRLAGFSVERLFGILNRLGHNVEVRISDDEHEPEDTYTAVVA
jgi:predicted XRE-type DNA-binding protein